MLRRIRPLLPILLLALSACGDDAQGGGPDPTPPYYCDPVTPCTDAVRTFCDLSGEYPDSNGQRNTCIEPPPDAECSIDRPCTDEAKSACTQWGKCVECVNYSTCRAEKPRCNLSTNMCDACRPGEDGDTLCSVVDPLQPYCSELGSCSECLVSGHCGINTAPICDQTTFKCRACETGEECDTGNCNTDTGVCIAPAP
jgi:hypothetical protein